MMKIQKTRVSIGAGVLEQAPDLVRQVLVNLPSLRNHLDSSDLALQDQEIRRAFVMRYLHFKRSGICMFPECPARSVPRSHAISRAASLSLIAENGHVVAPTVSHATTTVRLKKTGLRAASTFPGFCREHELLFRSFEQTGRLHSVADWSQQFFRTACWEMRTLDYAASAFVALRSRYDERVDAHARTFLRQAFQGTDGFEDLRVQPRHMDSYQAQLAHIVEELEAFRSRFREEIFDPLRLDVFDGGRRTGAILVAVDGITVPLCLGGSGAFFWSANSGKTVPILALLQVLPTPTGTSIGMLAPSDRHTILAGYLKQSIGYPGGLGSMLETWMLHGTHQWFLRPSFWDGLPSHVRAAVEHELTATRYDLGISSNLGLFTEILGSSF